MRQLLAKAESTTFDAEPETFTAGAQALMARHSIDAAMLQASSGRSDAPRARRVGIDRPYESPKAMLLGAVAEANRCRIVWSQELGFVTVWASQPTSRRSRPLPPPPGNYCKMFAIRADLA